MIIRFECDAYGQQYIYINGEFRTLKALKSERSMRSYAKKIAKGMEYAIEIVDRIIK